MEAPTNEQLDKLMEDIEAHVEDGYSLWDKFRKWLCGDLIEREIGITLIAVRRALGRQIQANPRDHNQLSQFHQWLSSALGPFFTKAWDYLREHGIDWKTSEQ